MYSILEDRVIIELSGEDRLKFLQGLITNDIYKLNQTNSIYAFILTPQGKYSTDLFIKNHGNNSFLIDLPIARKDSVLSKLRMYKLRSNVDIKECPEHRVLALTRHVEAIAETSRNYLDPSVKPQDDEDRRHVEAIAETSRMNNDNFFPDPRSNSLGRRGFIHQDELAKITKDLVNNQQAYDLNRIEHFIPEGEKDLIAEKSFILEYGFDNLNAIDYKKGCYVGQELIARTHYSGEIRKEIVQITSDKDLPELGTIIYIDNKKLGIICSSVGNKGLALIRQEYAGMLDSKVIITENNQILKIKSKRNI